MKYLLNFKNEQEVIHFLIIKKDRNIKRLEKRKIVVVELMELMKLNYPSIIYIIYRYKGRYIIKSTSKITFLCCISYSGNFISVSLCATLRGNFIYGHDIELIKEKSNTILKRFTSSEIEYINKDYSSSNYRFHEVWTRKESIAKMFIISLEKALAIDTVLTILPFKTIIINESIVLTYVTNKL